MGSLKFWSIALLIGLYTLVLFTPAHALDLNSGVMASFNLDDSNITGTTAIDGATGRNGYIVGHTSIAGVINQGRKFTNTNLTTKITYASFKSTGWAISLWTNGTKTNNAYYAYVVGSAGGAWTYLGYNNSGPAGTVVFGPLYTQNFGCAQNFTNWSMITMTYNGTHGVGYINGTKCGAKAFAYTESPAAPTNLSFGLDPEHAGTPAYLQNTGVDEILVYNRSLNDSEVLQLYNNQSTRNGYPFTTPAPYFTFQVNNSYNGTLINGLCLTATGTNKTQNICNTTSTSIGFNTTGTYNITLWDIGDGDGNASDAKFYNVTLTNVVLTTSGTTTSNSYQSLGFIQAKTIWDAQNVLNFTVRTPYYVYNTTNGTITIPLDATNSTWNITANGFYNATNVTVDASPYFLTWHIWTINGMYTSAWRVLNNLTNATETPDCSFGPYDVNTTYLASTYQNSYNVTCSAFGFVNTTFGVSNGSNTSNVTGRIHPVQLYLTFSTNTSGYIAWANSTNSTEGISFFNVTNVAQVQSGIGYGRVTVVYNAGQQVFSYENDQNTHINQYLYVASPTFVQPVKLWDGVQQLTGRILAYKFVNGSFVNVYTAYTDNQGVAQMLLEDGNLYKLTGEANGYTTTSQLEYIAPSATSTAASTLMLRLSKATTTAAETTFTSDCPGRTTASTLCSYTANSGTNTYTHTFQVRGNTTTNYTYSEATSATLPVVVDTTTADNNGVLAVDFFIDGTYQRTLTTSIGTPVNETVVIGPTATEAESLYDQEPVFFLLGALLTAIVIGYFAEQKFDGWGHRVALIVLGIIGIYAPVLYAVVLLYGIWQVRDRFAS